MPNKIILQNEVIDAVLERYRWVLGVDFARYRGHCFRIWNYLHCMGMDAEERALLEVALPFHDIGVWTHRTMDYLGPSCELAEAYVREQGLPLDQERLRRIILLHHKVRKAKTDPIAEKLRRADLIDLSLGLYRFGIPRKELRAIRKAIPYGGFVRRILGRACGHAVVHFWRPFPYFKF